MGFDEAGAKMLFSGPVFKLDPVSEPLPRERESQSHEPRARELERESELSEREI